MVKIKKKVTELDRGDIIKVSFDPTIGHEQAGYRPALIISSNLFHKTTGFAYCLPVTSKRKGLLFEVEINGREIQGLILPHGTRTFDLTSRSFLYIETIDTDTIKRIQSVVTKIIME